MGVGRLSARSRTEECVGDVVQPPFPQQATPLVTRGAGPPLVQTGSSGSISRLVVGRREFFLLLFFPCEVSEPQRFSAANGAAAPPGVCLSLLDPCQTSFFLNDSCVCVNECAYVYSVCPVVFFSVGFLKCAACRASALVLYSVELH